MMKSSIPYVHLIVFAALMLSITGCGGAQYAGLDAPERLANSDAEQRPESYSYSVFLIGDAGDASLDPLSGSLRVLRDKIDESRSEGAVVFLGDNLYPHGLPPEDHPRYEELESRLLAQVEIVRDFDGPVHFVAGNHDWASSGEDGAAYVRRQEQLVDSALGRNSFQPDNALPGPAAVTLISKDESNELSYDINLIMMDTQWWIHPHDKPLPEGAETEEEAKAIVMERLAEQMRSLSGEEVLFASHHPLYSFGRHGGKFPLSTHLKPPIFGSAYALYRNTVGYPQDIAHKNYSALKSGILDAASEHDHLVFAAGHEHGLSFIPVQKNGQQYHQIVSGSGTRYSYVREKDGPVYTYETMGLAILRYYPDRSKRIEFYTDSGEKVLDKAFLNN